MKPRITRSVQDSIDTHEDFSLGLPLSRPSLAPTKPAGFALNPLWVNTRQVCLGQKWLFKLNQYQVMLLFDIQQETGMICVCICIYIYYDCIWMNVYLIFSWFFTWKNQLLTYKVFIPWTPTLIMMIQNLFSECVLFAGLGFAWPSRIRFQYFGSAFVDLKDGKTIWIPVMTWKYIEYCSWGILPSSCGRWVVESFATKAV